MTYKTHLTGGIVASTGVVTYSLGTNMALAERFGSIPALVSIPLILVGAVIGALLPDIDSPSSKARRFIRRILVKNPNTRNGNPNHRGIPHTPIFWVVVLWFLFGVFTGPGSTLFLVGLSIGVVSHLVLDLLNPAGIPIWFPFSRRKTTLVPIRAGKMLEKVVFIVLMGVQVVLISSFVVNILKL